MDFSTAFNYIREDIRWKQKFGIAALLNMSVYFWGIGSAVRAYTQASWLMGILSLFLILAPSMITLGYAVNISRNVREGIANPLPEWSFFKHWKIGATLSLASFAYILPLSLGVGYLLANGWIRIGGLFGLIDIGLLGFISIGLFFFVFSLLIGFLMATLNINFTRTDSLQSCFHWKGMRFIIAHRWRELFMLLGFSWMMGMVASRGFAMGDNFWFGAIISSIVGTLTTFMGGHLYGQVASMIDLDKTNASN